VKAQRPVALFLPSLGGGGAERNMVLLAGGLAAAGHRVDLVAADASGPNRALADPRVRVINLGVPRVLHSVRPLAAYLAREGPRVLIVAHEHANIAAVVARGWARVRVPLVLTLRSTLSRQAKLARDWRDRWALPMLGRLLYPRADRLVALSHAAARDAEQWLGLPSGRVIVIANPVISDRTYALARAPLDHPVFAAGRAPVVLAVGRLAREKDYPTLLEAMVRLRAGRDRAQLVILGDGPERESLQHLVARLQLGAVVTLAGYQANPLPWMARAAVVALASRYEGLPTVLIEALACGARVVSTDCPSGPREILGGGTWGTLVPVGDAGALAAALGAAIDAGRPGAVPAEALAAYTEERVVQQYDQLIAGLERSAA
jgi:glycosyltransferase involved in cell wall biosynthesis